MSMLAPPTASNTRVHQADAAVARRARATRAWLAIGLLLSSFAAFAGRSHVVAWGGELGNPTLDIPFSLDDAVAIAVPYVLRGNGDVIEIGSLPPVVRARNAKAMAAAGACLLVLHRNGTVESVGANPDCATWVPAGLSGVVAIDAGGQFGLALTGAGHVLAWGDNSFGQTDVPAGLRDVVAIAAGRSHALALRADGQVVAWGGNFDGELELPPGLADVIAIDAGNAYNLALKADGRVEAWGDVYDNPRPVPPDLPPARALGAGGWRQAAVVLDDGTIREWGFQEGKALPPDLHHVTRLSMGYAVNFALVSGAITPGDAIADLRVDLAALIAIEDSDRSVLTSYLDLAAWASQAHRVPLGCEAMRSFAALATTPGVIPYPDRVRYFEAQSRDLLQLMGCAR